MKTKKSLYFTFGISIVLIVVIFMSINATFNYNNTKTNLIAKMKENSKNSIITLKSNLKNLIPAYAVNEYTNLLQNEIKNKDIDAIVVKDYIMGEIIGKEAYITGKIREGKKIVDFDIKNSLHTKVLKNCYYKKDFNIKSILKKDLGYISICISNKNMKKELQGIIYDTVKNTIIMSIVLICSLFILFHFFLLKPISKMIDALNNRDNDGIPIEKLPENSTKELNELATTMNIMIASIRFSRTILKESENRLKYLLEMSPIAVRIAKNNGRVVVFANHTYASLIMQNSAEDKDPKTFYANKSDYDKIIKK